MFNENVENTDGGIIIFEYVKLCYTRSGFKWKHY